MKNKRLILTAVSAALIVILTLTLAACAPKDAETLIKENESAIAKASELTVTDTITLNSLKLTAFNTPYGSVSASFSGGNIVLTRTVSGKNVDVELTASGIRLTVSPYIVNAAINADAFGEVAMLFRARVRDDGLSYYASITGLDKVMRDASGKIEYKNDTPMPLDKSAIEVINLLVRQPITGNYPTNGEYDRDKGEYSYSITDDARINNELTRALKMLIGLKIDEFGGATELLRKIFATDDIEAIANDSIKHDEFTASASVKKGKYGYYFASVETSIGSETSLDEERTSRLAAALKLQEYLGDSGASIKLKSSIKISSSWSLTAEKK